MTDTATVHAAACALRALKAACPRPADLPDLPALRLLALGLGTDLPAVVAARDTARARQAGLTPGQADALFGAYEAPGAADRLRAATQCLVQGLPPALLAAALETWEAEGADRLKRDPYGAVFELGGSPADAAACAPHLSDEEHLVQRARWLLMAARRDGHTMLPRASAAARLLQSGSATAAAVQRALDAGLAAGALARVGVDGLADPALCAVELAIAQEVARRCRASPALDFEAYEFQGLTDEQADALRVALSAGIGVLTGGPGTGKSHVVRALVQAVGEDLCMLTAPTGRAARRVGGSTVHSASGGRLLRRPLQETTAADVAPGLRVLVVDEASMLSTELMTGVLNLAPRDCLVLLVGDADQLPPVGAGNVLPDMLASGAVPVGRLTYNHRCVSEVQRIALDVLGGRAPREPLDWQAARGVLEGVQGVVRAAAGQAGTAACGVLTPQNATRHALNRALQSSLRDVPVTVRRGDGRDARGVMRTDPDTGRSVVEVGGQAVTGGACTPVHPLLPGDAVMVLRNQNKKRPRPGETSACNGDVGELVQLRPKAVVRFEDGVSEFPGADPWLTLAYAATVHKFQGSECGRVVLPIYCATQWDRSLLYTAITRAKDRVTFVGSRADLEAIVARRRPSRHSVLACLLADALLAS